MQWLGAVVLLALLLAAPAFAQDAEALKARHAALTEQLGDNPFQRPLHLESRQTDDALQGDIYAVIEQPYAVVGTALQGSAHWCDILILHLNVKSCRVASGPAGEVLHLHIGRKFEQALADAYPFEFAYRVATATPDFLQVLLDAREGPLGTSRYRIKLEVVALDDRRSFLHLNVKSCRVASGPAGEVLHLHIGRKFEQALADAYPFEFAYRVATARPDFLQVLLEAREGPLGTSRYRIKLEVVALDDRRSFLHLSYSYAYGVAARVATQGYLATLGRNKVGFSIVGRTASGQPAYIGGMRGVIERNTMRYYLAIEAYLSALVEPPAMRLEKRLDLWHSGVEQYPAQLHELERDQYLAIKRKEIQRQQADAASE